MALRWSGWGTFALQKVMTATFMGMAMLAMSVLVPVIGISWLFIGCGMTGTLLLACVGWLEEPRKN